MGYRGIHRGDVDDCRRPGTSDCLIGRIRFVRDNLLRACRIRAVIASHVATAMAGVFSGRSAGAGAGRMTEIIIGISAFAAGMLCGTAMVGPKIFSVVSGTMNEMSHDLNPRRDLPQ